MEQYNVFISVGATATDSQEAFVRTIEERLRSEGLIPNTVGRNKFKAESPLKTIIDLMNTCSGTIIVALERTYFPNGIEKRGGLKQRDLSETRIATPWNQIEAAMAYAKGQPIMLIIEDGLKSEGLLEKGYDWYVMWVKPEPTALTTAEFNGVFSDWKDKVKAYNDKAKSNEESRKKIDPSSFTIGDIISGLKPSHLWTIIGAIVTLLVGAFAFGRYLSGFF